MGWDKDKIERNKQMKFQEVIESAKLAFIKTKIEEGGTIDFKLDSDNGMSFAQVLQQGLNDSFLDTGDEEMEGDEGVEEGDEFTDESTGDEMSNEMSDEGGEGSEGGEE
jgi:hypothetical protein